MVYTRPAHGDPGNDSSATDATVIIGALSTGLEAVEATVATLMESPLADGLYYILGGMNSVGTQAPTDGELRVLPFFIPRTVTLTKIGADVSSAGAAACVVRLGIYADNGTGYPSALVLDAGTIAGDSATVQEITISQSLSRGLYWFGAVPQGGSPALRTVGATGPLPPGGVNLGLASIPTAALTAPAYRQNSVSGALPGTFGTRSITSNAPIRIFIKT